MGAFNTVTLASPEECPRCHSIIRRRVQFKYGDTWQYDYAIGDRLRWEGNRIGRLARLAKALGDPEDCPVCGFDLGGVFDVVVRDGIIEAVVPGSTRPYIEADNSYIIVEE